MLLSLSRKGGEGWRQKGEDMWGVGGGGGSRSGLKSSPHFGKSFAVSVVWIRALCRGYRLGSRLRGSAVVAVSKLPSPATGSKSPDLLPWRLSFLQQKNIFSQNYLVIS